MQISLRAWRFILEQKHKDIQDVNYKITLTLLETKIPLLMVRNLTYNGITHISDFYNGSQLKSTDQIMTQYSLPSDRTFTCLRITHFLKSQIRPSITLPCKIWQFYSTAESNTKGIYFFYNHIRDKLTFTKTKAMGKWEEELGFTFSTGQWQQSFKEIHKASHCVKHCEVAIKMANRWHYTPYRLANYFPGNFTTLLEGMRTNRIPTTHALVLPYSEKYMVPSMQNAILYDWNAHTPRPNYGNSALKHGEISHRLQTCQTCHNTCTARDTITNPTQLEIHNSHKHIRHHQSL